MAVDDEKLKAEREARRKLFMDWDIEKELPADISGYKLHRIDKQDGRIYYAFGWTNEENGWEVRALFDEETMDYMVKMYLRLVTLTEIELITGDFDEFKRNLVLLTRKAIDHELIHRENVDTGILFFYNMYRDEYYGELRAGGIPGIIHQYDAKTIPELEEAINKNLKKDLHALYENPVIDD